jgi:hypothetical protein
MYYSFRHSFARATGSPKDSPSPRKTCDQGGSCHVEGLHCPVQLGGGLLGVSKVGGIQHMHCILALALHCSVEYCATSTCAYSMSQAVTAVTASEQVASLVS